MVMHSKRCLEIVQQDKSMLADQVSLFAELTQSSVTEEMVAELRIIARNKGDKAIRFYSGLWPVFGQFKSEYSDSSIIIVPQSVEVKLDSLNRPREEDLIFDSSDKLNVLAPNEESEQSYNIYNHPMNKGPLPVGRYRFTNQYTIKDGRKDSWGFTIEIDCC